jgi:outer membrane lipoprotein
MAALALLFFSACTSAISDQWLTQTDDQITFQELLKNPDQYKGKILLLGGQIVSTTVKEGESWVEVLQQPLDRQHKPKDSDETYGRFLVRSQGFLDPAIYAPGRKITIVGEVEGKKVLPLKELNYAYPLLNAKESHLWQPEESKPAFQFSIGVGGIIR